MALEKISNEQLYELLKEFKSDTNRRLTRLEDRVDAIYESRDRVAVSFTRAWAGASFGIAVFSCFFSLVLFKIMTS